MSFITKKLLFSSESKSNSPYAWNYTRLPGGNWNESNNQYGDWDLGNGRIVKVGQTIAYSDNFSDTWSYVAPSDDFYLLNNIAYGNGKFVSISKNISTINQEPSYFAAYSSDGINWTKVSFPSNFGIIDTLKYSDGIFIANGLRSIATTEGLLYFRTWSYSNDGITWNEMQQIANTSLNLTNITYGNGIFLYAKGTTTPSPGTSTPSPGPLALYKSSDGINWNQSTIPINLGTPEAAIYGDGKFIVFCAESQNSAIYSINNGNTWTPCNITSSAIAFRSIYHANGKFSLIYGSRNTYPKYLLSQDGINWYFSASPVSHLTYSNGKYIGLNLDLEFSRSSDFLNWVETNSPVETIWKGLAFGNGRFVSTGTSNVGIYSTNGKDWTSFTVPLPPGDFVNYAYTGWNSVIYVNARLFLFGYGANEGYEFNGSYSDNDGLTWNSYSITNRKWTVYYQNGMFIGVPSIYDVFGYSLDGINWSTSSTSGNFIGLAYGNGKFISLDEGGGITGSTTFAYSSDGITWQLLNSLPSIAGNEWKSIAFGSDKFVAISYSIDTKRSYASYSQDGLTWNLLQLPQRYPGDVFEKIIYADNKFLIISLTKKTVLYSNNGIDWNYYSGGDLPIISSYDKIVYGNNRFVSISNNKIDAAYTT